MLQKSHKRFCHYSFCKDIQYLKCWWIHHTRKLFCKPIPARQPVTRGMCVMFDNAHKFFSFIFYYFLYMNCYLKLYITLEDRNTCNTRLIKIPVSHVFYNVCVASALSAAHLSLYATLFKWAFSPQVFFFQFEALYWFFMLKVAFCNNHQLY